MSIVSKALQVIPVVALTAFAALAAPTTVLAATQTVVDSAPPQPRIENVPHRDGYVWASGHWEFNGHYWSWVDGSYLVEQRHAQWIPDAWEADGSQWRYVPGHWQR